MDILEEYRYFKAPGQHHAGVERPRTAAFRCLAKTVGVSGSDLSWEEWVGCR